MENFLRVDVGRKTATLESVEEKYQKVGGRSLIAKLLLDEVPPTCEPLRKHNKLILAAGLLAGTGLSSADRISMGGKSPLTGGIKESNSGGMAVHQLAPLGIKAVIIEGEPTDWYVLKIGPDGCSFLPAGDYIGMGTFALCESLLKKFPKAAITCIGPAGERMHVSAGVCHTDQEGYPYRISARGGLGAVMGSKKIKAMVIEGKGLVPPADAEKFKELRKAYSDVVLNAPATPAYRDFGTAALLQVVNTMGGLPTRNFSHGRFEGAEKLCGEALAERIKERGGEGRTTHRCMPGCLIGCSNIYPDAQGKTIVGSLEYETIALMGANLGIDDLDVIARLQYLCNDAGLDTMEIGVAIGIAMEAGVARFGDGEAAMRLLEEIRQGTALGRVIAGGAVITGQVLGVLNVPAVMGQGMAAYDPRAIKGMGTTYITSAMGADHTAGPTARSPVNHLDPTIQAALSLKLQKLITVWDCTGLCMFTVGGVGGKLDVILGLLNAKYGWDLDMGWFERMGIETLKDEYRFNELAGINRAHHRMPEAFTERELPEVKSVYDVSDEDIDQLLRFE